MAGVLIYFNKKRIRMEIKFGIVIMAGWCQMIRKNITFWLVAINTLKIQLFNLPPLSILTFFIFQFQISIHIITSKRGRTSDASTLHLFKGQHLLIHQHHLITHYMKTEKDILTKVVHPFIVQLHFSVQTRTKLYLISDSINGCQLFFHLYRQGSSAAFDPLDPNGNITIRWDIMSWTPDGYVAVVTMNNFQMYRHIQTPGWTLGWTWAKKEVIWSMVGAQTTEQGDCSKFKANVPHCCKKSPTVVDLLPGVPYNQQFSNCCKGGVVAAWGQDPSASVSAFQVSVGLAGTSNKTVKLPKNFTLLGPGPGYTCGPAKIVPPTTFLTPDRRRKTQALMTWNVTCTYSRFLASRHPSCCVSFSSFYNETITPCPTCACGCENKNKCVKSDSKLLSVVGVNTPKKDNSPLLQCTRHMCPVRVHWHVKQNYKDYWRAKVAITNFNYRMNYTQWTLVVQHPNLNNVTQVFSFNYKPLVPYESINDTGMFYGMKFFNDLLMEAGPTGNVQSELLLQKDQNTFTFKQGWAFPRNTISTVMNACFLHRNHTHSYQTPLMKP